MKLDQKAKLLKLDKEKLADTLMELAERSDKACDVIERLTASPKENTERFEKKLSEIKRSRRFISIRESAHFADELAGLLQDLKAGVSDPLTGVELVASFYKTDNGALSNCDDSNGYVGNIYRYEAKELFALYASQCEDKEKIKDIVLKLNEKDDYGVRDSVIHCAKEYLPENSIRSMIKTFQGLADKAPDEYKKRHWLLLIESLARQIKDAKLFEKTCLASWPKLSTAACIDISRVYLESGDVQTALLWVNNISEGETFQAYERDQLLIDIYSQLGDVEKLTEVLYRGFRSHHSTERLEKLLDVIGIDKKEDVINQELSSILQNERLSLADARFLIVNGKIDEAEKYLLERAGQLDGDLYDHLLSLAKNMETEGRNLVATIIYRSLLDSILKRGYTKAYVHGIRYLKKMDKLAVSLANWKNLEDHKTYKDRIYQQHRLKKSFWSKYKMR